MMHRPQHLARLLALSLLGALAPLSRAEQGMWLPEQIPSLASDLQSLGFTGDPATFSRLTDFPMDAIISLGGCSGSFISPDGLIATNHHCVQAYLQFNSKPDKNLMKEGFLARAEELWNGPGSRVFVTVAYEDVTAEVTKDLRQGMSDIERAKHIERRLAELSKARETDPSLRCTISAFYLGLKYYAVTQIEIQDVRLVYAPAAGIGNFGGETDNWQWPRHTGDFSFIRAYVGKDGKPAPYSKDNVPYQPKHWLKISPKGATPGELIFVAGYPGRTSRIAPLSSFRAAVEWTLPRTAKRNAELIELLTNLGKNAPDTALRVSTRVRSLNNALTKTRGIIEGVARNHIVQDKAADESALIAWIAAAPDRVRRYGNVLKGLNALQAAAEATREQDALLTELATSPGTALFAAASLNQLATEREKPDNERDATYQERNLPRLRETLERLQRNLDPAADRALLIYTLTDVAALPANRRIHILDKLVGLKPSMPAEASRKAITDFVEKTVAGSCLYDAEKRLTLFGQSVKQLRDNKDPLLQLALSLQPALEEQKLRQRTREGSTQRLGSLYAEALLAMTGKPIAPDANSTLRVTYGTVKGVSPRDGLTHEPQTTLRGIQEKHTGSGDFNAPAAELKAIADLRGGATSPYTDGKLGDLPVNYLSTVDTTGGNSGSATLNAKGELVGLLFDGTFGSVASDYVYDKRLTRSIHVDTRYLLWTLEKVEKAENLLKEIQLAE